MINGAPDLSVVETTRKFKIKFNNIIPLFEKDCKREGWDDEVNQYEKCGAKMKQSSCKCHPDFCYDCSAEVHGISLVLPGVLECSPIEHDCGVKGNY